MKNTIRALSLVTIVLLLLGRGVAAQLGAQEQMNLLVNGGFEGNYVAVPGGFAAEGWTTYYRENTKPPLADIGGSNASTRRPEFKAIDKIQYPYRVAEGSRAQVAFAFYGIMDAAFAQTIVVGTGNDVQFSIQAHGWASNTDDPTQHTGDVYLSLCIAADGQTWPWDHGIECTQYLWTASTYQTYHSRVVTAERDTVTVIILVTNKWTLKHNDVYLDDARAWIVQEGGGTCPTPEPCATPEPCPTCVPGDGGCSCESIRSIIREELDNTSLVGR